MEKKKLTFLILTVLLLNAAPVSGHEEHHHPSVGTSDSSLSDVREVYVVKIQPIFQVKCFDCHTTQTRYPWYYSLPGAKQLIDYDIREAREHIDMTDGFPFKGHHSMTEQLEALEEVVRKNKMPLWRYRLMHRNSGLTAEEREIILNWIRTTGESLR